MQAADTVLLDREQTFGDTEQVLLGNLTDVTVDDEGRVYISDGEQLDIKVYDSGGSLVTLLGRSGEGPGEFNDLYKIEAKGNRLFAQDRNQQRAVVFSLDALTYSRTVSFANNRQRYEELADAYPGNIYARTDGGFFMEFTASSMPDNASAWDRIETREMYFLLDENGQITSEKLIEGKSNIQVLVPLGGRKVGIPFDFYGKSLTAISENDHIYRSWSQELLVKEYSSSGEYLGAFYYPYERDLLDPKSAIQQMSKGAVLQKGVQEMEFPEQWPATDAMIIDDKNRIWVSTFVPNHDIRRWWVLSSEGQMLGHFDWPRDRWIVEIQNGFLYTEEYDEKTGLAEVVRYWVEIRKNSI
ncbi:6-bladed beta-propeller [Aliifodinibius sp. S!AR15-10]|uniref:6-bladed beta-propeller n=1 Tax=Aliifodinibius sp. S!AR15-10 TaxID=2950437 RepID=UPI0028618CB4|nr:6-bladed beta-propeller [Aliifodinibius sp. S!AR15-10]MDR8393826.1 6-bladed beta-propeller [Aliifodinibius sp. S!AR15-10]